MNLTRCFLSGLNFTSICVILCLLVPRRIGASKSKTHSGVLHEDVQWTHLADDKDFGSSRKYLEKYMRNKTRTHCSCGPTLFQKKFCSSDFVIVAKKASEPKQFYADPKWEDFNYAGLVVPLAVKQVLRGSIEPNEVIPVYFLQGSTCGVPREMIPDGDKSYIVAGFRRTFFKKDDKNIKLKETKEIFLVTKCSASEPLQSLSVTQITGAFLGLYCGGASCESEVYFEGTSPDISRQNQKCFYPFKTRMCYSKYTICSKFSPRDAVCASKAITRLPASPALLERFPPELHDKVKEIYTSKVNDEQRFNTCLAQFGGV